MSLSNTAALTKRGGIKKSGGQSITPHCGRLYAQQRRNGHLAPPGPVKVQAKATMKDIQKQFDRSVQAAKRRYWRLQQENIQELVSNDPKAFWQQVNQLGVGSERCPEIPWEVRRPDGTVLTDKYAVLETWECEFASLFRSNSHRDPWMTATVTVYATNN